MKTSKTKKSIIASNNKKVQSSKLNLSYSFKEAGKNNFQTIYYAHVYGTTFAIEAILIPIYSDSTKKKLSGLKARFLSKNLGGFANYGLRAIIPNIAKDEVRGETTFHLLKVKVLINTNIDHSDTTEEMELDFETNFEIDKDIFRVQMRPDKDIINLLPGMLYEDKDGNVVGRSIDDDWSCDIKFG